MQPVDSGSASDHMPTAAITGSSGLIGTALTSSLRADGWRVLPMVRRPARDSGEIAWQPGSSLDPSSLASVDAVIHLAGVGVGDHRWTKDYKRQIKDSRVLGTDTIAKAMAAMESPPAVLVSASAIGFYGDTGNRKVDESDPAGEGFLAEVVTEWEAAAQPAVDAGIRVVHPRTGLVVSKDGGAWARLFPFFRAGVGGRLGPGDQYWSFISMRDEVRAIRFLMDTPSLAGPVNLVTPEPRTNAEVTRAMGEVLSRPTALPVPAFALRAYLGGFSTEVLSSTRVIPAALQRAGFEWLDPTIEQAIEAARGSH